MSARDMFDLKENNYNGINLTGIVRDLAENYERTFDGSGDKGTVRVQYKELDTDPEFEKKYLEESSIKLSAQTVIVQGKHHYRILNLKAFFSMDENGNYYAFNGEYRFTTAMLQSSISEAQVVTFTYGNGEPIGASEVYASLASCKKGIASVQKNAPIAGVQDLTDEGAAAVKHPKFEVYKDKAGEFRFRLKAANGEIILTGESYKAKAGCLKGIESIRNNAPESPVVVE